MRKLKSKAPILAIGSKIALFVLLSWVVLTNMGAGTCGDFGGFNLCGCGSNSGGSPSPSSTPTGVPVTVSFMGLLDSISDWDGPLTFTVNGSTHNSVLYEEQFTSLQTLTVTLVSGGPPGASFNCIYYGTNESSDRESSKTVTFTLGADSCFVTFAFLSASPTMAANQPAASPDGLSGTGTNSSTGNIAVHAALDGKPWEGNISYSLQGPDAATGSSVPQSHNNLKVGIYSIKYLSGGPKDARFTNITPADNKTLASGDQAAFTLNFQSHNKTFVAATLDGKPWSGSVSYNLAGPESSSGSAVPFSFTGLTPGEYSPVYQSGGPENARLSRISPSASQNIASSGAVYFVLEFSSSGIITVNGLANGSPWSGPCQYDISGPVKLSGTSLPQNFKNVPAGEYALTYISGAPAGTVFGSVTPPTRALSAGSTVDFQIRFSNSISYPPEPVVLTPPTITSFVPAAAGSGASITITGTYFTGATSVSFGGTPAAGYTVDSASQITAVVGAGTSGAVSVTTPGGTATKAGFTFIPLPTVTSVSPSSGPSAGGTTVTISGTGFTGATGVSFGGTTATSFTVDSNTQITATSPAHAAGAAQVTVTTPGGTSTEAVNFTFIAAPTVVSVSPTQGSATGGTTVTITGTGFTGVSAVKLGGTTATAFTVNSPTQIIAISPAHAAGLAQVTVTTVGGTSSNAVNFTFIDPPTITSFVPAAAGSGASITITGTYFTGATSVSFGGTPAAGYTVDSASQITAVVGAGTSGAVSVTTPGGTATKAGFTFIPLPTVTSVSPSTGPAVGGTTVTITGTGFTGATAVSFGNTPATSFTVDSNTQITATSPAHAAGAAQVTVTTPGGASTEAVNFTFIAAPTVTSLLPASGPSTGGTTLTITGTNFTGATLVNFGGTPAAGFTVISSNQIAAIAPAHAAGAAQVIVSTSGGTSANPVNFTFMDPPIIISLEPSTGITTGGILVVISGFNLTGATAVSFGGTPAASFTVDSDTQITATNPAHAVGAVQVTVTTPGGTSTQDATFTYTVSAADLRVAATADDYTPSGAGYITYTITITNDGPATATGIRLKFLLSGVSYVSNTPSQGTYNSQTGIWDAGTIASNSVATLDIYVGLSGTPSGTVITNTAEIIAASPADPDSTPNNGDATEDDQASVTVTVA